jgi:drug/metabolite transporter (DMT)-like permease
VNDAESCDRLSSQKLSKRTTSAASDIDSESVTCQKVDSYLKATVFINLFAILCTIDSSVFKVIAFEGVRVIDYTAVEGFTTLVSTSTFLMAGVGTNGKRINPFSLSEFPRELYLAMFLRMLSAQVGFFLNNICLTLIPFTLLVIIFQTSPFWVTILAYYVNGEQFKVYECIGIVLCFIAVIMLTVEVADDVEEEDSLEIESASGDQSKLSYLNDSRQMLAGLVLIFICSWAIATTNVLNRSLRSINPAIIMFYHALGGIVLSCSYLIMESAKTGQLPPTYTSRQYLIMVLCGLLSWA